MVRKISFAILSVAILVSGYTGFKKLAYWDRSSWIFKMDSNSRFEGRGRMGRGPSGEEFRRPDFRELPDSLRKRFEQREGFPGSGVRGRNIPDSLRQRFEGVGGPGDGRFDRNIPDSLRQQFSRENRERTDRGGFEGSMGRGGGRGRGEFPGGRKINLRSVQWFLAVFAMFTVIVIYLDKAVCLLRKIQKTGINRKS